MVYSIRQSTCTVLLLTKGGLVSCICHSAELWAPNKVKNWPSNVEYFERL